MPFDFYPFIRVRPDTPPKPRLYISIIEPKTQHEAKGFAFIDSGANHCFLPCSFAKQLKINWRKGTKIKVHGPTGKWIRGYRYLLSIRIYGILLDSLPDNLLFTDTPKLELREAQVIFTPRLQEPILGVKSFLDMYVYTVNHARERFSVRIPVKDRACEICRPG